MTELDKVEFTNGTFSISDTYPFKDPFSERTIVGQFSGLVKRDNSIISYHGYLLQVEPGCESPTMKPIVIYQVGRAQCRALRTIHFTTHGITIM